MKWIGRAFLVFVVLFGAVSVAGFFLRRSWGKDLNEIKFDADGRRFEAKRDDQGLWTIKAERREDLWFAFGYVQAVDREFQLELFRALARAGCPRSWDALRSSEIV